MATSLGPSPLPDRASIRTWLRVAIPIVLTFFPVGLATGLTAKANGFTGLETGLMAATIYAAPVQIAVAELWTAGAPLFQMVVTGLVINLRFLIISFTLVPYFRYLRGAARALAAQTVSMSSFAGTLTPMQRAGGAEATRIYLSVGVVVFPCWVMSCLVGFGLGTRFPGRYDEALRFVFPVFIAAMLAADVREAPSLAAAAVAFLAAPWAVAFSPRWGLILAAVAAATLVSLITGGRKPWIRRGSG
ncbi:MAG TPA: AzlC family ABC transporter permease [Candidatus Methylomirabilis sp.]